MPEINQAALDFLLNRRSRPWKTLSTPVPDADELDVILTAAARTPDHGKLQPWRFIVLQKDAMQRISTQVVTAGERLGEKPEMIEKSQLQYAHASLAVAVIYCPKIDSPIPEIEQTYSAGAVCMGLLNAALASGWGANWLSGWASHDPDFCAAAFGLSEHEKIAGIIHLGTEDATPSDRPRPDLDKITTWVSA